MARSKIFSSFLCFHCPGILKLCQGTKSARGEKEEAVWGMQKERSIAKTIEGQSKEEFCKSGTTWHIF